MKIRLLIPFLLLLVLFQSSCVSYEELQVSGIKDFGIAGKSKDGLKLNIGVGVKNPNNMKIKVKKADLDFKFNGRTLGKLDLDKKVVIAKNSDERVDLAVNVQSNEILKGGLGALLSTVLTQKAEVSVQGTIKVKAFIFTKKIPINVTEKVQMPKF